MSFHYRCFGLTVVSPWQCSFLQETPGPADIFIRAGTTPVDLTECLAQGLRYRVNRREFLFWVDDLARFYVRDGCEITVELWGQVSELWVFLLGTAMGALLMQRGLLTLHGSCVILKGEPVAFLGNSGIGKSTLAAALCRRGAQFVSDDVCALDPQTCAVVPSFPKQNLWQDSFERLGLDYAGSAEVRPFLNKRVVATSRHCHAEPLTLRHIYVLAALDREDVGLRALHGKDRFFAIERNIYRPHIAKIILGSQLYFQAITQVSAQVEVSAISRPTQAFLLDELCVAVEQDLDHTLPLGAVHE